MNEKLRLKAVVSRSTDGTSYRAVEVGPTLNIFARRFLQPVLTTPNMASEHQLVFGIGYRFLGASNQPSENRIEVDVTPQVAVPWRSKMQLGVRNRIDLRFIEGSGFSWRYRGRLKLQRTFKVGGFSGSPYAQVEVFYGITSGSWTKTAYQGGFDVPLRKHFDFQVYYEHDINYTSTPKYVNAVGLTTSIYF